MRSASNRLVAQQEAVLTRSNPNMFGGSVALTADQAFVGDPRGHSFEGSVSVFDRSGSSWSLGQTLTASDGQNDDYFGTSIAVEGSTALVGTFKDNTQPGAVYVFERQGASWSQTDKLTASNGLMGDGFGVSVAISQDTAVVGSFSIYGDGSWVYVFERDGGAFTETAQLGTGGGMDGFGFSVDIDADTVVVGAPWAGSGTGAVYVYERSGSSWDEEVLVAPGVAIGATVGSAVAVEGDTLLASATHEFGAAAEPGEVHVFTRGSGGWTHTATLQPSDSAAADCFGSDVELVDGAALVGASHACDGANPGPAVGAAYWFVNRQSGWQETQKLEASDSEVGDLFGEAVAVESHRAVVGAGPQLLWSSAADGNEAAYVFSVVREEGDPCADGTQCENGVCEGGYCTTGGAGGTGGTAGSAGASGVGGAAGSTGGTGGSTGGTGGSTGGTGASAGAGGLAGSAGEGGTGVGGDSGTGAAAGSGGAAGANPGASPSDDVESSGFYACATRGNPGGAAPGIAAWLLALLALRRSRRRDA